MARGIKSLLNKKSWTGKEVGKALLMNLKNDIENKGNPNKKPLFSQEDFNRMLDSLDSDTQYTQYKVLETIYSSIVDSFNYNEAMKQQFLNGYYRYFLAIREAQRAEDFYTSMEKFPLILTMGEYDKIKEEREAYKRGFTESYYSLFFHTLGHYVDLYRQDFLTGMPADIMKAIADTQSQSVTNKRILDNWAEDTGAGYYVLSDGRRSDDMPSDEWRETIQALYLKSHPYIVDGEVQDIMTTIQHDNERRILYASELLYKGVDAIREAVKEATGKDMPEDYVPDLEAALEDIADGLTSKVGRTGVVANQLNTDLFDTSVPMTWHYYTEPPKDLTKYEVLTDMLDRYCGGYSDRLLDGDYVEEVSQRDQYKEFTTDYPELAKAVSEYMEERVSASKGLKATQLSKDIVTWGELADISYIDFPFLITVTDEDIVEHISQIEEDNTENYNKRTRVSHHGIAILRKPRLLDMNANGDYVDPIADKDNESLQSLDYLEANPDEAEYIANNLKYLLAPALQYMYAYNAFIEVVAAAYDIEFMTVAKYDLSTLEGQIEAFNNMLYLLYKDVYGTDEDKKRKRAFIKSYFSPIEIDKLKPTEEAVEALKEKINELGYTREAANTLRGYRRLITETMRKGVDDE